jgi:hypothetical protein
VTPLSRTVSILVAGDAGVRRARRSLEREEEP